MPEPIRGVCRYADSHQAGNRRLAPVGRSLRPHDSRALVRAGYDRTTKSLTEDPRRSLPLELGCEGISWGDRRSLSRPTPVRLGWDRERPGGGPRGRGGDGSRRRRCLRQSRRRCPSGRRGAARRRMARRRPAPDTDDPLALLALGEGAVATSTTLKRRWRSGGVDRHHLIDPARVCFRERHLVRVGCRGSRMASRGARQGVLLNGGSHPFDILGGTGAEASR